MYYLFANSVISLIIHVINGFALVFLMVVPAGTSIRIKNPLRIDNPSQFDNPLRIVDPWSLSSPFTNLQAGKLNIPLKLFNKETLTSDYPTSDCLSLSLSPSLSTLN